MRNPTDEEIETRLIAIIVDGFNRSIKLLESAGAISTKNMKSQGWTRGCKYYDSVTEQVILTARYGMLGIRDLFRDEPKAK